MLNKKQSSLGKNHTIQQSKHVNNDFITEYASGDINMKNSIRRIVDILKDEKCKEKKLPFNSEKALDLDEVEKQQQKGAASFDRTVDFIVGLQNKQLLLVEAKFDANNMDDVASKIKRKISHSKDILVSNINFVRFHNKNIILLSSDKMYEQNRRKLKGLLAHDTTIDPLNVVKFYNEYFSQ